MKSKNTTKSIVSSIPILALVFMVLLSPCKVRNFVQANLGIPQTEVSNKGRIIINNSNCSDSEIVTTAFAKVKSHSQQLAVITTNPEPPYSEEVYHTFTQSNRDSNGPTPPVPLYILYQNFKYHL